jgi:hypothetical protein
MTSTQVIPGPESLIGDLLSVDIGGGGAMGADLLGGGLDIGLGGFSSGHAAPVRMQIKIFQEAN